MDLTIIKSKKDAQKLIESIDGVAFGFTFDSTLPNRRTVIRVEDDEAKYGILSYSDSLHDQEWTFLTWKELVDFIYKHRKDINKKIRKIQKNVQRVKTVLKKKGFKVLV